MSWSTSELRVRLGPWNRFKLSSKIFLLTNPRRYFFCGSFVFLYPATLKSVGYYVIPSFQKMRSRVFLPFCTSVHPSVSVSFSLSAGSIFYQLSSNLLWELILGSSVLGLQMGKFWQISIELRPLIYSRNWFSLSILAFIKDFLQTWYESRYCEGVFWDCKWVNFDK